MVSFKDQEKLVSFFRAIDVIKHRLEDELRELVNSKRFARNYVIDLSEAPKGLVNRLTTTNKWNYGITAFKTVNHPDIHPIANLLFEGRKRVLLNFKDELGEVIKPFIPSEEEVRTIEREYRVYKQWMVFLIEVVDRLDNAWVKLVEQFEKWEDALADFHYQDLIEASVSTTIGLSVYNIADERDFLVFKEFIMGASENYPLILAYYKLLEHPNELSKHFASYFIHGSKGVEDTEGRLTLLKDFTSELRVVLEQADILRSKQDAVIFQNVYQS